MKIVDLFKKEKKLTFSEIIARAKEQRDAAMEIFVSSRNQLLDANVTINETSLEVAEAMYDLEATKKLLEENKEFNDKLIANIGKIIEQRGEQYEFW